MSVYLWNVLKGSGILLVISVCIFQYVDSVEIDLLEDLSHTSSSEFLLHHSTVWSLNLTGINNKNMFLSTNATYKILKVLSDNKSFAICLSMIQDLSNSGIIFSIMYQEKLRFLDIKASLRRKIIKIQYFPNWKIYGLRTEKLSFNTTLRHDQPLCITYNNNKRELSLSVDCITVSSVLLHDNILFTNFNNYDKDGFRIWIGQRNNRKGLFKGILKRMVFSDDIEIGSRYCLPPITPTATLTTYSSGQVDPLTYRLSSLEKEMKELKEQLSEAQKYMKDLKQCQCLPQCVTSNAQTKSLGEIWMDTPCSNCTCTLRGKVCQEEQCQKLSCAVNITDPGKCCPRCAYNCQYKKKKYPHNQGFSIGCMDCHCDDGTLSCRRINPEVQCPKLKCKQFLQVKPKGQCCKKCITLCEWSKCGSMASCVDFGCRCNPGYEGNPYKSCVDVDECRDAKTCPENSICVNTNGSFNCVCKPGYKQDNSAEFPTLCKATCSKNHCRNNSTCVGPDQCECKSGFMGPGCDIDIDECALGLIKCPSNSQCINTPGGYICQCISGYHSIRNDTLSVSFDSQCEDVNECSGKRGTEYHCESESSCVNIPGGYQCIPKTEESKIFGSNCAVQHFNGEITVIYDQKERNFLETCKVCRCQSEILKCEGIRCDCSLPDSSQCCPSCSRGICDGGRPLGTYISALECSLVNSSCHNAICPKVTCSDSILLPGQCCKYCMSDTLTSCIMVYNNLSTLVPRFVDFMPKCAYGGRVLKSGETFIFRLSSGDSCIKCLCWNRHFCCGKSLSCS